LQIYKLAPPFRTMKDVLRSLRKKKTPELAHLTLTSDHLNPNTG